MNKRSKQWTAKEIELLASIKANQKQKKWKLIAKDFQKKGLRRIKQECRNKWVNCLDPDINHKPWTSNQLQILYEQYNKNCSQWSTIQKSLPGRTQIKIKNHFYGVIRNIIRNVLKYFKEIQQKQSNYSNRVNPNSLQLIYRGEGEYSFMGLTIKNAVEKMSFRFDKETLLKIVDQQKQKFRKLNEKVVNEVQKIVNDKCQHQQVPPHGICQSEPEEVEALVQNIIQQENSQFKTITSHCSMLPAMECWPNQACQFFTTQNLVQFNYVNVNPVVQIMPTMTFKQEEPTCPLNFYMNFNNYFTNLT